MLEQDTPDTVTYVDCVGEDKDLEALHKEPIEPLELVPLVAESNLDMFNNVATAFAEAERRIKSGELMDGVDIPSVNELRYVSYHLFKALKSGIADDLQREELKRAERHCKRASFDALELGIITAIEKVAVFREEYTCFPVSDVLSDYHDMMSDVQEAVDFLHAKAGSEYRDEYYAEAERKVTRLVQITRKLQASKEDLNKKRQLFEEEQARATQADERAERQLKISNSRLKLAVLALLLGVGGLFFKFIPTVDGFTTADPQKTVSEERREKLGGS